MGHEAFKSCDLATAFFFWACASPAAPPAFNSENLKGWQKIAEQISEEAQHYIRRSTILYIAIIKEI